MKSASSVNFKMGFFKSMPMKLEKSAITASQFKQSLKNISGPCIKDWQAIPYENYPVARSSDALEGKEATKMGLKAQSNYVEGQFWSLTQPSEAAADRSRDNFQTGS
jgi:hypothetical protein